MAYSFVPPFQMKPTNVPQNYGVNDWKFNEATIYDLTVDDLYANRAIINTLSGTTANISNLIAGTVTIPPLPSSSGLNAVTYNTSTQRISYNPFSLIPPGTITQYAGSSAPDGYLLCDGSAVSRSLYALLFNVIGTSYGNGDGSTTFNTPNLKGKVVVCLDGSQTEFDTLGETGGSKTNTLTTAQLPAHSHTGTTDSAGLHNHGVTDPGHTHTSNATGGQGGVGLCLANGSNTVIDTDSSNGELNVWTTPYALSINSSTTGISIQNSGTHTHTFTTNNTGSGTAINNLQPYFVLNYIIKY